MRLPASSIALAALLSLGSLTGCGSADGDVAVDTAPPTLVVAVRHAEKQVDGTDDPALSDAGQARANELARVLADAGVDAIYTTTLRRTRDTAKPLADRLSIPIVELDPRDTEGLIARLRKHPGETVLVVGHSNTVPDIVTKLGAKGTPLAEHEYDDLFFVVAFRSGAGYVTHLAYGAATE